MSVDDEVALDLGCERCAKIYLAIFRGDGVSWLEKIIRDTGMKRKTVMRHLNRLLTLKLVKANVVPLYEIVREIDSLKKLKGGDLE